MAARDSHVDALVAVDSATLPAAGAALAGAESFDPRTSSAIRTDLRRFSASEPAGDWALPERAIALGSGEVDRDGVLTTTGDGAARRAGDRGGGGAGADAAVGAGLGTGTLLFARISASDNRGGADGRTMCELSSGPSFGNDGIDADGNTMCVGGSKPLGAEADVVMTDDAATDGGFLAFFALGFCIASRATPDEA